MNSKIWIRKALSTCLVLAIVAVYSMVALAGTERIAGELLVSGKAANGQALSVKVNGDSAQSGRSIFTASTIATPDNASAILNLGKAGKVELAPNTVMSISFDENTISGELAAGRVTILNAAGSVNVKTPEGNTVNLNTGESADAAGTQTQTSTNSGGGHGGALLFAIILGGAAAGIILAATSDNNRVALGGGATVVSTTR